MGVMFPFIWLLVFIVGLAFLVRILCALFSEKIAGQIRRHPIIHSIWALPGLLVALILLPIFYPGVLNLWPPHWLELKHQRETVLERVQSAGGWEELRKDCVALAATNLEQSFQWFHKPIADLPPAIAVLKPMSVQCFPPQFLLKDETKLKIVHIEVFGMHRTGGHDTPFYGLDVLCDPEPNDYQPQSARTAPGNSHFNYRKITNGIYEVY
jgi:hypothetical protein